MRFATVSFLLLTLCTGSALAQPADVRFEDEVIPSGTYTATVSVSARNATVQSGAAVTFRAGQTVRLEAGFKAELGATLFAETDPSLVGGGTCDLASLDLPPTILNARFYPVNAAPTRHPSLSLNGFDCEASETGCGSGLGLQQILQGYDPLSLDDPITDIFNQVRLLAGDNSAYSPQPSNRAEIQANTQRMQALAFEALAAYVLERNPGCDLSDFGLRDHATAMQDLRQALTNGASWQIVKSYSNDGVKWTWLVASAGRTLDLYLALENAYEYYGNQGHQPSADEYSGATSNRLLSPADKRDVLIHHFDQFQTLERAKEWGGYGLVAGIDRYSAEAGNASLKMQTAIGYAALTWQNAFIDPGEQQVNQDLAEAYVQRAANAAFRLSTTDRRHYFNYQTGGGKYYWAEGPYYFQFTLNDLLPFWHTMRANDLFGFYGVGPDLDPFQSAPFTRPLHWLADTATPDAQTPPLDDGNKHRMANAMLLRWTSEYGDEALGRKFAWIANRTTDPESGGVFGYSDDLLLVELAIPRLGLDASEELAPPNCVTNDPACAPGDGDDVQQLIIRRKDRVSRSHYVLLNGERDEAYGRGEGHEQPDQAQLLYHINGNSLLMDSGYDQGGALRNSTWDSYAEHNVLQAIEGEGGLPPPIPTPSKKTILVINPSYLNHMQQGRVDLLRIGQPLPHLITRVNGQQLPGYYEREVLFVNATETAGGPLPYLIDLSRGQHDVPRSQNRIGDRQFKVSYHVNSPGIVVDGFDPRDGTFIAWNNIRETPEELYAYPVPIEYVVNNEFGGIVEVSDDVRELVGEENEVTIRRLDVKDRKIVGGSYMKHFSLMTILQARDNAPGQDGAPSYAPQLLWEYGSGTREYHGWIWQQNANTFDVFVARSIGAEDPSAITAEPALVDPNLPDICLRLAADEEYGFVRLVKEGGVWVVDEDYQVSLEIAPPPAVYPPTDLRIVNSDQPGTLPDIQWTASITPDVMYELYRAKDYTTWTLIGTTTATRWVDSQVTIAEPPSSGGDADDFYRYRVRAVKSPDVSAYSNLVGTFAKEDPPYPSSRASANDVLTEQVLEAIPKEYALEAAYPNPFNPQATIRYALPEAADVRLMVYDVVGREVARLVEGKRPAGFHRVRFNGARLASGLYLYRLVAKGEAGAFSKTGRMVLVK